MVSRYFFGDVHQTGVDYNARRVLALGYLNTQEAPLFYPPPFLRYLGCDCSLSAVS